MSSHFPIFRLGAQFLSLLEFMALLLNLSTGIVLMAGEYGESLESGKQSQKKLATSINFLKVHVLFLSFVQICISPP